MGRNMGRTLDAVGLHTEDTATWEDTTYKLVDRRGIQGCYNLEIVCLHTGYWMNDEGCYNGRH